MAFEKAVAQLRQVEKHKDRPIIVKAPSGFLSEEKRFATCQLAIDFLEQSDPTKAIVIDAEVALGGRREGGEEQAERKQGGEKGRKI